MAGLWYHGPRLFPAYQSARQSRFTSWKLGIQLRMYPPLPRPRSLRGPRNLRRARHIPPSLRPPSATPSSRTDPLLYPARCLRAGNWAWSCARSPHCRAQQVSEGPEICAARDMRHLHKGLHRPLRRLCLIHFFIPPDVSRRCAPFRHKVPPPCHVVITVAEHSAWMAHTGIDWP